MTDPEPPTMLSGEEGESYILVSEFTDEEIHKAAATAIDEWSLATEAVPEQAVTKLAATATKHRFREHTTENVDCDCHGEDGAGWWCDFGKGEVEGLYVMFEFGIGEDLYLEAVSQ